jgi:protein tyrosine/serine phosphatase
MPLNNLGLVCAGLWRCAQPDTDGFALLSGLHVTTIIKLNDNGEYPDKLESDTFKGDVICHPYPRLFFVPAKEKVVATVQKIIELLNNGKYVAVHCTHGVDRTGLVIGAFRIIQLGWTTAQVKEERYLYGVSLLRDIPDHAIVELLEAIEADHAKN